MSSDQFIPWKFEGTQVLQRDKVWKHLKIHLEMAKKEKITTNENFGKAQSESDFHAWKTSSVAEL